MRALFALALLFNMLQVQKQLQLLHSRYASNAYHLMIPYACSTIIAKITTKAVKGMYPPMFSILF